MPPKIPRGTGIKKSPKVAFSSAVCWFSSWNRYGELDGHCLRDTNFLKLSSSTRKDGGSSLWGTRRVCSVETEGPAATWSSRTEPRVPTCEAQGEMQSTSCGRNSTPNKIRWLELLRCKLKISAKRFQCHKCHYERGDCVWVAVSSQNLVMYTVPKFSSCWEIASKHPVCRCSNVPILL